MYWSAVMCLAGLYGQHRLFEVSIRMRSFNTAEQTERQTGGKLLGVLADLANSSVFISSMNVHQQDEARSQSRTYHVVQIAHTIAHALRAWHSTVTQDGALQI